MSGQDEQNAYIFRISPSQVDRLEVARRDNEIIIGLARARELMDETLTYAEFKSIVKRHYYAEEDNDRRTGQAAGNLWRFMRDMKPGDLAIVPVPHGFHVARITGAPTWDEGKVEADTAFRRPVEWLTSDAVPRSAASSALQQRMKTQGTSAKASEFVDEVRALIRDTSGWKTYTFEADLRSNLIERALDRLRNGLVNNQSFEYLLKDMMIRQGAIEAHVTARKIDVGLDVTASFPVAGLLRTTVGIQAKHFRPEPPVGPSVVDQLARGMELTDDIDLGIVATSGTISDSARERAQELLEEKGLRIEFLEGEQIASMLVEQGVPLPD